MNGRATGRVGRLITGAVVTRRVRRRGQTDLVAPVTLRIGRDAVDETGVYAADHSDRALVVTDLGVRTADLVAPVTEALDDAGIAHETFHGADAPVAREGMTTAATLAMLGRVDGGKAAIHAVAYGVQATYDVPHAEAVATVLPEVLACDLPAVVDRLGRLGTRLYGAEGTPRDRAERVVEGVRRLRADLGPDRSLRAVGATEDDLPEAAERAPRSERHLDPNLRPLNATAAESILGEVW